MRNKNIILGRMLCLLILATVHFQGSADQGKITVQHGRFMRDGQPFYGIGMNMFNALIRSTGMPGQEKDTKNSTRQGFETLARYKIPFVRFCASGFYPKDWDLYFANKEKYFAIFDTLVQDAEETGMGLIPSLFWTYSTVPDLNQEPLNHWGKANSRTRAFMTQYTTEVVERYKDSPAIWAWEFGNEYLQEADLPQAELGRGWLAPEFGTPAQRTEEDKVYRPMIWSAYASFVETVRQLDKQTPIVSGDTLPRTCAHHTFHERRWKKDSAEQWQNILLKDNEAMDALSVHFYHYALSKDQHYGIHGLTPAEQMLQLVQLSEKVKKPLFIGEFGPDSSKKSVKVEREQFEAMLQLIIEHKVPMSALWNFDFKDPDQEAYHITDKNHRAYMLTALQKANEQLQK